MNTWLVFRHELFYTVSRRSFLLTAFGIPIISALVFAGISLVNRSAPGVVEEIVNPTQPRAGKPEGYVDLSGLIEIIPEGISAEDLHEYPDRESVSVFQTDDWVSMAKPRPSPGTEAVEDYRFQKGKSRETILSKLSTCYLVWKDKNGTLGFGNLRYPEISDASHIHINGSWEPVAN